MSYGVSALNYIPGVTPVGRAFDPVTASASSLAHGRIGRAAWALFERGDGLVLSIDLPGEPLCVVPIDSEAEKMSFGEMAESLLEEAEKRFA